MKTLSIILTLLSLLASADSSYAQIAVRGNTVHTMAGESIQDGVIIIRDGKIVAVGKSSAIQIPPDAKVLTAQVVTPGLVDAHTAVGLSGSLNQNHDQDQFEKSNPVQPELRAIDAYNARELLVSWVRSFGVTTIHTGHAPGAVMTGQTLLAKTRGHSIQRDVMQSRCMIAATVGDLARGRDGKPPGTRSKVIALLRAQLIKANEYAEKMKPSEKPEDEDSEEKDRTPGRDLRLEALVPVLQGEVPLLVTTHRAHDILSAIRVAQEFQIKIVLDGAAEAYLVLEEIKKSGFPVILHPTMARSRGELENKSMETAALLKKAGIRFALQSGFESYVPKTRVILFEAGIAACYGLTSKEALASITIDAARILGIADRVGSIEVGKDADLALYDGDPLEYTSHCIGVLIDGEVVSELRR